MILFQTFASPSPRRKRCNPSKTNMVKSSCRLRRCWIVLYVVTLCMMMIPTTEATDDPPMTTPGERESDTQSETGQEVVKKLDSNSSSSSNDDVQEEPCLLDCVNGGECRLGRTSSTDASSSSSNKQGHFCFCPTGFTGIYCEIKFVMCQDELETCFNGNACLRDVDDGGDAFWHCECDTDPSVSNLASRDAGRFCAHAASTTYCSTDSDTDSVNAREGFYCANSGKCSRSQKACTCPPEWTGAHCEIPVNLQSLYESEHYMDDDYNNLQQEQQQTLTGGDGTAEKTRVAYVSLIIILGTFASIFILVRHYGAEVRYGRLQLRPDEPPPGLNGHRRKRRPHPMELEMQARSAQPHAANGVAPHEVI